MRSIEGKVAIVTGGGRGIGAATAIGLACEGAQVFLVDRTGPLPEVAAALGSSGTAFHHLVADLSLMESIKATVEAALACFGRIDILVNNAGIIRRTPFLEHTEKDWDDVLTLNLKTPMFLSQACARQMIKQGSRGKIINICSLLSYQGGINIPGYTAAKSGLAGLTRAMATELAPHGINVNGIAPGYISTDNTAPLRADPVRSEAILARIPEGRWGSPDDLVGAAVFLAGPGSDYVQGHILTVDGGWMAR